MDKCKTLGVQDMKGVKNTQTGNIKINKTKQCKPETQQHISKKWGHQVAKSQTPPWVGDVYRFRPSGERVTRQ